MKITARIAFVFMCLLVACATGYSQQSIYAAIKAGNLADVEQCLQNGADVNAMDKEDQTPLMTAARGGHLDVVKFLVDKGADVNARNNEDQAPLMFAAFNGYLDIAKFLAAKGADVNVKDKKGSTPLMYAAFAITTGDDPPVALEFLDMVKFLFTKGADVNTRNVLGATPLSMAAGLGKLDTVRFLVANGANMNARDKNGKTPLMNAASMDQLTVVEFLKQQGAKEADGNKQEIQTASPREQAVEVKKKQEEESPSTQTSVRQSSDFQGETTRKVGFGDTCSQFLALRSRQIKDKSREKHIAIPPEYEAVLQAVYSYNYLAASNAFEKARIRPYGDSNTDPIIDNPLQQDVLEIYGAFEQFAIWCPSLIQMYGHDLLGQIPSNSIFFVGTDSGRFVVTAFQEVTQQPFYVISQNQLANNLYMDYLRDRVGTAIWLPEPKDVNKALRQYVNDVRNGLIASNTAVTVDQSGKVGVHGVQGVMEINGIVSKEIFEQNKGRHDFYVEESYVINWMYPYLSPHGLIMKINKEPLPKLTDEMVKNDMVFWGGYFNRLMKDLKFQRDIEARNAFSKLRCAIAGMYSYRKMMNEAEIAFRQAVDLYPTSPEANFRLADMYLQMDRFADALQLMETNLALDPNNDRITEFISQIKDMSKMNVRINELQAKLSKGNGSLDMVFELAAIYQRLGREQPFQDLSMQVLNNTNIPPQAYLKVAELASNPPVAEIAPNPPRWSLIAESYQRYLQREKSDSRVWLELACTQTQMGQYDRAIQSLRQAVACGGEPLKDVIRKDTRLDPLRGMDGFQTLMRLRGEIKR